MAAWWASLEMLGVKCVVHSYLMQTWRINSSGVQWDLNLHFDSGLEEAKVGITASVTVLIIVKSYMCVYI